MLHLIKLITHPVINRLFLYGAIFSRRCFCVQKNKSVNTQDVTKQEFPKYQAQRNPTHQIDSLKKEINKNLFARADSLVDKILSCPPIKL